jgi:hypothetical protein
MCARAWLAVLLLGGLTGLAAIPAESSATTAAAAPAVTRIVPNNGPVAGGTSLTITGTGFTSGSTVEVGTALATGVLVNASTSITALLPSGSGTADVRVINANGASPTVPADQFGYDLPPSRPWLGLNGNSAGAYLGSIGDFSAHEILYDRSSHIEWTAGQLPRAGDGLEASIDAGMIPVITIEYSGYGSHRFGEADPSFPTGAKIEAYVNGFLRSAEAIGATYPGRTILLEPINEPWAYTDPEFNAAQYADVVARLLPRARLAGIPLSSIYVAALGEGCSPSGECGQNAWIADMYTTQPKLHSEIAGWYFHPYGLPSGVSEGDSRGIQSLPVVQSTMTSGQNNIIVSEVGYCASDVNGGEGCEGAGASSAQTAQWLTEVLEDAVPYHEAGWLRALLVYSRNAGGWAMELPEGRLTKQGEALDAFADSQVATWSLTPTLTAADTAVDAGGPGLEW